MQTKRPSQHIRFGRAGNDTCYIGNGWSGEGDGFRWMVGPRSQLWLEHPGAADAYVLAFDLRPFTAPSLKLQNLTLRARGEIVLQEAFGKQSAHGCIIPAALLQDEGPVCLTFEHPDAASPASAGVSADKRLLSFQLRTLSLVPLSGGTHGPAPETGPLSPAMLQDLTGEPASTFVEHFESLGDNCEFGLVQRRCGAEPISLLRFANLYLQPLIAALDTGFAGIGNPDGLTATLADNGGRQEFIIFDKSCHMTYHSGQFADETTQQDVLARQPARQRLLARKLLEELQTDEKIMVLRRNPPLALPQVLAAFAALRRVGPARLLWVTLPEPGQRPAPVTEILPGLYRGELDRLAPDANAPDLSLESWLRMLAGAWRLAACSRA